MKRALVLAMCAVVVAFLSGCATNTVLLVTQYPEGSERAIAAEEAVRKAFRFENLPFNLFVYNMDASQRDSNVWREQTGHNAVIQMQTADPEVTLVMGDEAAALFAQRMVTQPRKMVYFDINGSPSNYGLNQSRNVTGLVEETPSAELFDLIREMVPNAKGVAVISDSSLEGNAIISHLQPAGQLAVPVVDVRRVRTLADWMAAVQDLQGKADALVLVSWHSLLKTDGEPETVPADEVLQLTASINRLPDFSFTLEAVDARGVTGAVGVPVAVQAKMASKMAIRTMYYDERIGDIMPVICAVTETRVSEVRAAQTGAILPAARENLEIE